MRSRTVNDGLRSSTDMGGRLLALLGFLSITPLTAYAALPAPPRALTDPRSRVSPAEAQAPAIPVADLFYTRSASGASWSPDGKDIVISTNLSGRMNLWRVPASGGWPIQLAQSDDRQTGAAWSPDGRWIAFESDRAGGEIYDVFAAPADGGAIVNLTATDDVTEGTPRWSPDGKLLAFERKQATGSTTDIAVLDVATRSVRQLTHETVPGETWDSVAWSRDGRHLYANRTNAGLTDASAFRIDLDDGKAEELTRHRGQQLITLTAVSADGRTLALSSNAKDGISHAALFDPGAHTYRWIDTEPWESRSVDFSPDGRQLLWWRNADGRSDLFLYDLAAAHSTRVALDAGVNLPMPGTGRTFAPDGRLLVSHQSSTTPADYWIVTPDGNKATQLTYSALASLARAPLPAAQLVHYRSFDGTVISAFAWIPFNLQRDGRAPAVVLPHGGPTGQTLDTFNRTAVALASRGYVCIAPNVRGSTGYGLTFQKSNYQDLGGGDLRDEIYAAQFLVATGYVDAKKIGIAGGSYGGFMALMALGRTPDAFAAGVDLFGVTNWLSEQQHEEPALQQYDRSILGDPVKDRAAYERSSPTTYFSAIRAPLLVLQGENDIRDPKEEAEQAFKSLTASGKTVEVHYYPGEGHGFLKRENQIDALERLIAWFDRYLKGNTTVRQP